MKTQITTMALILACATVAQANEATVCKSKPLADSLPGASLSDKMEFSCGNGAKGTIPSLAKDGWQIVSILPMADVSNPMAALSYQQLVLQKLTK